MIAFVNEKLRDQFDDAHLDPLVRALAWLISGYCEHKYGNALWVTSVYRKGDKGVHGHWRGIDVDNNLLSHEELEQACKHINWIFRYDPDRVNLTCAMFHTVDPEKKKGWHIHLQVHPHSRLR